MIMMLAMQSRMPPAQTNSHRPAVPPSAAERFWMLKTWSRPPNTRKYISDASTECVGLRITTYSPEALCHQLSNVEQLISDSEDQIVTHATVRLRRPHTS